MYHLIVSHSTQASGSYSREIRKAFDYQSTKICHLKEKEIKEKKVTKKTKYKERKGHEKGYDDKLNRKKDKKKVNSFKH